MSDNNPASGAPGDADGSTPPVSPPPVSPPAASPPPAPAPSSPPPAAGSPPPAAAAPPAVAPPPVGYPAGAVVPAVPTFANGKPSVDEMGEPVSDKSRLACTLLCFFIGALGIHRFYVGKIGTGILMIVTLGGLGLWVLIDLIMILVGSFRDKEGRRVYNW